MKKWEYKCVTSILKTIKNVDTKEVTMDDINKLGEEGWEMCGTTSSVSMGAQVLYFKREIEVLSDLK